MSKFSKFREDLAKQAAADDASVKSIGKTSKVFAPGSYEVIIKECVDTGPNKRDPEWLNYMLLLEGAGGKQIRCWLDIPTNDLESPALDGRYELSTYKKLMRFLNAVGIDTNDVGAALTTYFEDPTKLVNLHVKIEVGYTGLYADFMKNAGGSGFQIHNRDGSLLSEEVFESRDAVKAFVQQQGIKGFKDYPEIRKFEQSETKNNLVSLVVRKAPKLAGAAAQRSN